MEGWVAVLSDTSLQKVELTKAYLNQNGINSIVFNQQDSTYQTFGEIHLMVHNSDFLRASVLVKDISGD